MEMENTVVTPETPEAPIEFLVADKARARKKVKALDVVTGLFGFLFAVAGLMQFLFIVEFDFSRFNLYNWGSFGAYAIFALLSLIVLIVGAAGRRRGVHVLYYLLILLMVVGAALQCIIPNLEEFTEFTPIIIEGLGLALAAVFGLIAFFMSFSKSKSLNVATGRLFLGLIAFLPAYVYFSAEHIAVFPGIVHDVLGGTFELQPIFHGAAVILGLLFGVLFIIALALRLLDRNTNVDSLKKVEVVQQVVAPEGYAPTPAPRKKVIWVGRRRD